MYSHENHVNCEIIVGVPLLIKAIVLCIQNILEVLLKDIGILKMESVGIKINYHLLTSIYVTSILSYTVLEDDANDEK